MDIRTKLVFALVAAALGSMLLLGVIMFDQASRLLFATTREQFEGLAESRRDALAEMVEGWRERVQLIASRTQLRLSLREYAGSRSEAARARIERILEDAAASVRTVEALAVYDREGRLVAMSGGEVPVDPAFTEPLDASGRAELQRVLFPREGSPRVAFVAGLFLDGVRGGTLYAELGTEDLIRLTRDFAGLGATGEVLIAARDSSGEVRLLHPVRHALPDETQGSSPTDRTGADAAAAGDPVVLALDGVEAFIAGGVTDYRGESIWAATRHLPDVGWGLVVKFDAAEKRASLATFRRQMINLGLSLGAFAILAGTVLGLRFARPIHDLAETASRIRDGELEARVRVASEDEVGMLARTFNQMADELEERMSLLREFHRFFEVSLDMLCIAGTDGYFKRTNPACERVLGWSHEELRRRPFVDFVHPDDVDATLEEIVKLREGIPTISFTNRYLCADGSYKRLRWTGYPDVKTGRVYAVARHIPDEPGPS